MLSWLTSTSLLTLFLLVSGDDWFADEMYYTSTSSYPCVKLLNNDAEMGCTCMPLFLITALSGGSIGELVLVETLTEAEDFWASPKSDTVIVLAGSLFSLYRLG